LCTSTWKEHALRKLVWIFTLAVCAAGPVAAGPVPLKHDGVVFTQLSPTVWMHTSYRSFQKWGQVPANGLIVIEDDRAILVDSGWTDADAIAVLDWAEHKAGIAIDRAVFTHSHSDKMGGVDAIVDRGITTYALDLTNEFAISDGLTPAENTLVLTEGGEILTLGPVEVFFPGPGHSADNIVVHIKDSGILFAGCLVRPANSRTLGNTNDANVNRWAETVKAAGDAFPSSHFVIPTHGAPGGRELIEQTARLARAAARK
jgi:metallo-beta-lactamase class B